MKLCLLGGRLVDPLDVPMDVFDDIDNVAHVLSQTNRYNGHTRFPYSVAQHSVLLSKMVPEKLQKAALIHDFSEFIFGDLIWPLKRRPNLAEFDELEAALQKKIFEHFNVDWSDMEEVSGYDRRICIDEMTQLNYRINTDYLPKGTSLGVKIDAWLPNLAKIELIARYKELFRIKYQRHKATTLVP